MTLLEGFVVCRLSESVPSPGVAGPSDIATLRGDSRPRVFFPPPYRTRMLEQLKVASRVVQRAA